MEDYNAAHEAYKEGYDNGYVDRLQEFNGLSPDTVKEMYEALKDIVFYHSDSPTGYIEGHKLGGTIPFQSANKVLTKAEQELKK